MIQVLMLCSCVALSNAEIIVKLESAPMGNESGFNFVALDGANGYMASINNQLFHWNDSDLGQIISLQDHQQISAFALIGDHYWLATYRTKSPKGEPQFAIEIYDKQGHHIRSKEVDFIVRQILTDGTILFHRSYIRNLNESLYFPMLYEVESDRDHVPEFTGLKFCKVSDRLYEYNLNLNYVWAIKKGDTFVVVNQLDPAIHFYTKEVIKKESVQGDKIFTPITQKFLKLPKYHRPPDTFLKFSHNMLEIDASRLEKQWWCQLSLIIWFGKHEDGFAIVYRVPEFDASANCKEYHFGIQKLNASFSPVDTLFEIKKGQFMGVRNGRAFLMVTSKNEAGTSNPLVYSYKIP